MNRMSREGLRTIIAIALKVQPGYLKTIINKSFAHDTLVEDLTNRIMGPPASEAVILRPSMVGSAHAPSRGRWDVHEPHPHPDLPPIDHA